MYIKKICGYVVLDHALDNRNKSLLDYYDPPTQESSRYKNWIAIIDPRICWECLSRHGQIYLMDEIPDKTPPIHRNCRCEIIPVKTVEAGQGTKDGQNGADWWMKYFAALPDYYITEEELKKAGWKRGKFPIKFASGKMITMGIYQNRNQHLPQIPGRIWREADINYYSGRRNGHRLLWSNDGLLFVTYDHYQTFLEVI